MADEHWAVSVYRQGELVVTIETNSLAGRDLSPEDEACIRLCARHLLAFVGDEVKTRQTIRADRLRDAICSILSATGAMSRQIPSIAKQALERDNQLLNGDES